MIQEHTRFNDIHSVQKMQQSHVEPPPFWNSEASRESDSYFPNRSMAKLVGNQTSGMVPGPALPPTNPISITFEPSFHLEASEMLRSS